MPVPAEDHTWAVASELLTRGSDTLASSNLAVETIQSVLDGGKTVDDNHSANVDAANNVANSIVSAIGKFESGDAAQTMSGVFDIIGSLSFMAGPEIGLLLSPFCILLGGLFGMNKKEETIDAKLDRAVDKILAAIDDQTYDVNTSTFMGKLEDIRHQQIKLDSWILEDPVDLLGADIMGDLGTYDTEGVGFLAKISDYFEDDLFTTDSKVAKNVAHYLFCYASIAYSHDQALLSLSLIHGIMGNGVYFRSTQKLWAAHRKTSLEQIGFVREKSGELKLGELVYRAIHDLPHDEFTMFEQYRLTVGGPVLYAKPEPIFSEQFRLTVGGPLLYAKPELMNDGRVNLYQPHGWFDYQNTGYDIDYGRWIRFGGIPGWHWRVALAGEEQAKFEAAEQPKEIHLKAFPPTMSPQRVTSDPGWGNKPFGWYDAQGTGLNLDYGCFVGDGTAKSPLVWVVYLAGKPKGYEVGHPQPANKLLRAFPLAPQNLTDQGYLRMPYGWYDAQGTGQNLDYGCTVGDGTAENPLVWVVYLAGKHDGYEFGHPQPENERLWYGPYSRNELRSPFLTTLIRNGSFDYPPKRVLFVGGRFMPRWDYKMPRKYN